MTHLRQVIFSFLQIHFTFLKDRWPVSILYSNFRLISQNEKHLKITFLIKRLIFKYILSTEHQNKDTFRFFIISTT